MNYNKDKDTDKEILYKINNFNIMEVVADEREKRKLKYLYEVASFQIEIYEKGEEWYNSGLSLEDAPEEYRNNRSFINGYKRGERIALIAELESKRTR